MKGSREYQIKRIDTIKEEWRRDVPKAEVNCFPWARAENDFCPLTNVYAAYNDTSIFVFMETAETELRALARGFGFVHTDSCMEFFLSPDPSSPHYINWEFNPAGAMYLSIGTERNNRTKLPQENYREFFQLRTAVFDKGWNLEYCIPFSFLQRFFPLLEIKTGCVMRGNFYKCGDETAHPHYGCWSPIHLSEPDFHCPDFFGTFVFC